MKQGSKRSCTREFLAGTADLAFSVPAEEAKLRQFVARLLRCSIRIDTVQQGDRDGANGIHHVKAADVVYPMAILRLGRAHQRGVPVPRIALLLEGFPFTIRDLRSDPGSEYVDHDVAGPIEKRVEFTKSRPRQTNDSGPTTAACSGAR